MLCIDDDVEMLQLMHDVVSDERVDCAGCTS